MAIVAPSVKWYDGTNIHQYNGLVDESNNTHPTFANTNQARAWYRAYYYYGNAFNSSSTLSTELIQPLLFRRDSSKNIYTPLISSSTTNSSLWVRASDANWRAVDAFRDRTASDCYSAIYGNPHCGFNFRLVVSDWIWIAARCNYSVQMWVPSYIYNLFNSLANYGIYSIMRFTMGVRLDKSGDGDYINGDFQVDLARYPDRFVIAENAFNTEVTVTGGDYWQQILWLTNGGINTTQYWGRPRIDFYNALNGSGWYHRGYMNDYSSKNYSSGNIGSGKTYYFSGLEYTPELKRVLL